MFGDVVLGVSHELFEQSFDAIKAKHSVTEDTDVPPEGMIELCDAYKSLLRQHTGQEFPQDPFAQLELAVKAVFDSWETPRARRYREV